MANLLAPEPAVFNAFSLSLSNVRLKKLLFSNRKLFKAILAAGQKSVLKNERLQLSCFYARISQSQNVYLYNYVVSLLMALSCK